MTAIHCTRGSGRSTGIPPGRGDGEGAARNTHRARLRQISPASSIASGPLSGRIVAEIGM